jgi:thymidylate synthase (FAD)
MREPPADTLNFLELCARTCYKSEGKISEGSAERLIKRLLSSGHHSVIEHAVASIKFTTDRGVSHELVRHRLASYSQESTRYCSYGKGDIQFILPVWMPHHWVDDWLDELVHGDPWRPEVVWIQSLLHAETAYKNLLEMGWRPEQARSVLPNSLKTEIVVTANLREWRHIFKLRCSQAAHPQIRGLMQSCLEGFKNKVPVLFEDLPPNEGDSK